ncbi:MAG: TRIC cation channel family protein, partial [Actinomycetota bacterium]
GTVRDVLLNNRPIFWIQDPTYLLVILAAAAATLVYVRFFEAPRGSLLVADAFGLAVFTFIGARTAYDAEVPGLIVVLMGAITGAAGGVMRDVLCAEVPLILRREVYATAAIAGATVFVLLKELGLSGPVTAILPVATVFLLRLAAIHLDLNVPRFGPPR